MRNRTALIALVLAGCTPGDSANDSTGNAVAENGGRPIVAVAQAGANCVVQWNGQTISAGALSERTLAAIDAAVRAQGGLANAREMPSIVLEAPSQTPYACADVAMRAFEQSGIGEVALRLPGNEAPPAQVANLALPDRTYNPRLLIELGPSGTIRANGQAADLATIRQYVAGVAPAAGPGEIIISVASIEGNTFGTVYEALRTVREAGARVMVSVPAPAGTPPASPADQAPANRM